MPKISALHIYPIKSCGGIPLDRAILTPSGIEHDREFVLVDARGEFLSQRTVPTMCLIRTYIIGDELIVSSVNDDGGDQLTIPLARKGGYRARVNIWDRPGWGLDMGNDVANWFEKWLGIQCRLLKYDKSFQRQREDPKGGPDIPLSFADGYPVLIISEASLGDLNSKMAEPIPMDRFRPNIVVTDCDPYAEDGWDVIDTTEARLRGGKLCVRCSIPMVDQATGRRGKEPSATLSKYRRLPALPGLPIKGVVFGKNFSCPCTGALEIGDLLEVS